MASLIAVRLAGRDDAYVTPCSNDSIFHLTHVNMSKEQASTKKHAALFRNVIARSFQRIDRRTRTAQQANHKQRSETSAAKLNRRKPLKGIRVTEAINCVHRCTTVMTSNSLPCTVLVGISYYNKTRTPPWGDTHCYKSIRMKTLSAIALPNIWCWLSGAFY